MTFRRTFTSPSAPALGDGTFEVVVSFYLPNTMDGDDTAEITCTMDQKEMEALIGELDRLCENSRIGPENPGAPVGKKVNRLEL